MQSSLVLYVSSDVSRLSDVCVPAVSVGEAMQSLITGKRNGGFSRCLALLPKKIAFVNVLHGERDVETGAQVLQRAQQTSTDAPRTDSDTDVRLLRTVLLY